MSKGGGSSSKTPAAPDYMAIAKQQGADQLNLAKYVTAANRVNQNNPYGSTAYTQNGDGTWTMNQTLNPSQQKILDNTQNADIGTSGVAASKSGDLGNAVGNLQTDYSKLAAMPINGGQTAQDAITARLQPQTDHETAAFQTDMANKGIMPGSDAYKTAATQLQQGQNDRYIQSALQGMQEGRTERQQGYNEQASDKSNAINDYNGIRSGSQVNTGSQQAIPLMSGVQAPDSLGAASLGYGAKADAYNAKQASSNQKKGSTTGLVGNGMSAYFSDRKLKSNIEKIGELRNGLNWYRYDIFGHSEEGVMADEVAMILPHAVINDPSGYQKVIYSEVLR